MRVLRIENEQGKGFITLPELLGGQGIGSDKTVSCFTGGELMVPESGIFTEIELIQMYLLYFNTTADHYFYKLLFYGPKRWECDNNGQLTQYVFFTDFEFIDLLKENGLSLYFANLSEKDVFVKDSEGDNITPYQATASASSWHSCKRIYKGLPRPSKMLTEPLQFFKGVFCGEAPAMMYLQTPKTMTAI